LTGNVKPILQQSGFSVLCTNGKGKPEGESETKKKSTQATSRGRAAMASSQESRARNRKWPVAVAQNEGHEYETEKESLREERRSLLLTPSQLPKKDRFPGGGDPKKNRRPIKTRKRTKKSPCSNQAIHAVTTVLQHLSSIVREGAPQPWNCIRKRYSQTAQMAQKKPSRAQTSFHP